MESWGDNFGLNNTNPDDKNLTIWQFDNLSMMGINSKFTS